MNRTYIKDLCEGQVKIKGMVETIRDKKIMFLVIRDVTGMGNIRDTIMFPRAKDELR